MARVNSGQRKDSPPAGSDEKPSGYNPNVWSHWEHSTALAGIATVGALVGAGGLYYGLQKHPQNQTQDTPVNKTIVPLNESTSIPVNSSHELKTNNSVPLNVTNTNTTSINQSNSTVDNGAANATQVNLN